jgi:K+-transporting ATPase ATPase C chain
MKELILSLRLLAVLTLLTGGLYPLGVWALGRLCCPEQAGGSLVRREVVVIGSRLLAQDTSGDPRYFHARPSAAGFATVPSGASNQAWTSAALANAIRERSTAFPAGSDVPAELLTASGSGLDPELTPAAIRLQAGRVAAARRLSDDERRALDELIAALTVGGHLTPARINVLALNLALDTRFPPP